MAQIAVTIIDPAGRRSAHLVETQDTTRDVIAALVARLELPGSVVYELLPLHRKTSFPAERTLDENGVEAGAELWLRPAHEVVVPDLPPKSTSKPTSDEIFQLAPEKKTGLGCMGIGLLA